MVCGILAQKTPMTEVVLLGFLVSKQKLAFQFTIIQKEVTHPKSKFDELQFTKICIKSEWIKWYLDFSFQEKRRCNFNITDHSVSQSSKILELAQGNEMWTMLMLLITPTVDHAKSALEKKKKHVKWDSVGNNQACTLYATSESMYVVCFRPPTQTVPI